MSKRRYNVHCINHQLICTIFIFKKYEMNGKMLEMKYLTQALSLTTNFIHIEIEKEKYNT